MERWLRSRSRRDEGAVIAMVAASMIVIMGAAALTIDLGNGWRTRRALIPATDAGALAAVQDKAFGGTDAQACATAESYVLLNEADTDVPITCTNIPISTGQAAVSVTATHNVQTWFASVIGLGDYTVSSTSTAVYGTASGGTGLRPIGLCVGAHPMLEQYVRNPSAYLPVYDVEIFYDKNQPDPCHGGDFSPGNWGILDFNGQSNPSPDIEDQIQYGYDDLVEWADDITASGCAGEPHCYEKEPGNIGNNVRNELQYLVDNNIRFYLPVIDYGEAPGGGSPNAKYHVMGVIHVELEAFKVVGNPTTQRFVLDILPPGIIEGPCCGPPGPGPKVITICGVDPGDYAACDP